MSRVRGKALKSTVARKAVRLTPSRDRISVTGNRSGCGGRDRERSDHRRAARGSHWGDTTAVDTLTVVITQLWVLVNFHKLAHNKTYTVKKFKFLIF